MSCVEANNSFFAGNQATLEPFFTELGLPEQAATDLELAHKLTQPWVKGDHSLPEHRVVISDEQAPVFQDWYDKMGLTQEVALPEGHYDQILVLGAIHRGNTNRLNFLRRSLDNGISTNRVLLMGGERKIYPSVEPPDIAASFRRIAQAGTSDMWVTDVQRGAASLHWETDLMRLAAVDQLGAMATRSGLHLVNDAESRSHITELSWEEQSISLVHTAAVARKQGKPRHNTQACMEDWINTVEPLEGSRVAFISANPHILRMGKVAAGVLRAHGRNDVNLSVGGPSINPNLKPTYCLGEIGRNIHEDWLLAQGTNGSVRPAAAAKRGKVA